MSTPTKTPRAGLAAVFDAHLNAEFVTHDVDATMATMTGKPELTHVPVITGGSGRDEVRDFYSKYFIGCWPADLVITHLSRTIGEERVVDELIASFTHDVEMPALLPGIAPTGREVELAHVVVVGFEDGKVAYEHIYWDQASLLVQIGLLDPAHLPVTGAEQAHRLRNSKVQCNHLIQRAEKRRADPAGPA